MNPISETNPAEPTCDAAYDSEHAWESPHELGGGVDETTSARGTVGGGYAVREVCMLCGMGKIAETVDDHTTRRYVPGAVSIARLVEYHAERRVVPRGLDSDAELMCMVNERPEFFGP